MMPHLKSLSLLSVLFLGALEVSAGSHWLTLLELYDLKRGPEFARLLLTKHERALANHERQLVKHEHSLAKHESSLAKHEIFQPFDKSELVFAGFEVIRSAHLTFESYRAMLADPGGMMAKLADPSAEAQSEHATLLVPLGQVTQTLFQAIEDKCPVDPNTIGSLSMPAYRHMWTMAEMDIESIKTLMAPGAMAALFASIPDLPLKLAIARIYGAILMQVAMMLDTLTRITRDANRIIPLEEAVIAAATGAKAEIRAIAGDRECTKIVELGLTNAVDALTKYKMLLEVYQETGLWVKNNEVLEPAGF